MTDLTTTYLGLNLKNPQQAVSEPAAFERANYMKALNVFDPYLLMKR